MFKLEQHTQKEIETTYAELVYTLAMDNYGENSLGWYDRCEDEALADYLGFCLHPVGGDSSTKRELLRKSYETAAESRAIAYAENYGM